MAKNVSYEDYRKFFLGIKIEKLNKMSKNNTRFFDGKGKQRIVTKLIQKIKEQENKESLEFQKHID